MATATQTPAVITLTLTSMEAKVVASLLEHVAPLGAGLRSSHAAGDAAINVLSALDSIGVEGLDQRSDGVWAELNSDYITFVTESP